MKRTNSADDCLAFASIRVLSAKVMRGEMFVQKCLLVLGSKMKITTHAADN
jgi:hypothetical protein